MIFVDLFTNILGDLSKNLCTETSNQIFLFSPKAGAWSHKKVGGLSENNELYLLIIDYFNVTREEGIFPIRVFLG